MQNMDLSRTVVAVSSGIAPGLRSVIRISGSETRTILLALLSSDDFVQQSLDSRHAISFLTSAKLRIANRNSMTVPARCYWWPDDRSFTGEPCAELHLLGSLPIVESIIETAVFYGASIAERGEFTLRSFLAGKLDLTQAEAVLGVIEADRDDELEQALGRLGGNLSQPVKQLCRQLLELTAHLEAGLDFVEEDIEFITVDALTLELRRITDRLTQIADRLDTRGSRTRELRVLLVGLPNAGKSSLFNALAEKERAIVSDIAGTTRDAVTTTVRCGGLAIELVDTAGIEELQEDTPRALAQSILESSLSTADAILFCIDCSRPIDARWLESQTQRLQRFAPLLHIGTKADLFSNQSNRSKSEYDVKLACHDREAVASLRTKLANLLSDSTQSTQSSSLHQAALRCHEGILLANEHIADALDCAESGAGEELVAADLRLAMNSLQGVIGEIHTEDILGEIFGRFCIGK